MKFKIAVASSDGKVVNQHFGKCDRFTIVELDAENKEYQVIGIRDVEPACGRDGHTVDGLINVVKALSDCNYVIVTRIGLWAEMTLKENGIEAIESFGFIEDALHKFYR